MIVAHVLSSFGMGGQERIALDLARGQVASGHRVLAISLAALPDGPHADNFRAAGARVFTLTKRAGFDIRLPLRLRQLFAREKVQIVHTHNPQPLIYGAIAGRLVRAGVVHSKHGANPDTLRRRRLRRIASHFVDAYVAVSKATAEVVRQGKECSPEKLCMIPNGIDLAAFAPDPGARTAVRREFQIAETTRLVGTVGRLAAEKNQELLIRSLAPKLSDSTALMIVGDGPEKERLAAVVDTLPHSVRKNVILTGARSDVPRLLAAFDVFALSSLTEGLPLVIPEAMAAGLPVVSTAVGGIPDVIADGETGFLVPSEDEAGLREKLLLLIGDAERCKTMGARARALALNAYSARRMLHEYMELYAKVLSERSGSKGAHAPLEARRMEADPWLSSLSRHSR